MNIESKQLEAVLRTMLDGLSEGKGVLDTLRDTQARLQGMPLANIVSALAAKLGSGEGLSEDLNPSSVQVQAFWRSLLDDLAQGNEVLDALGNIQARLEGTSLGSTVSDVVNEVEGGASLSEALSAREQIFSRNAVAMVVAAEAPNLQEAARRIAKVIAGGSAKAPEHERVSVSGDTTASEATLYVDQMLRDAVCSRASDIHLDPTDEVDHEDHGQGRIRLRIDGVLHDVESPPDGLFASVLKRIKALAAISSTGKPACADGRIQAELGGKPVDLRVSVLPTYRGDRIVMRILDRENVLIGLDEQALSEDNLKAVSGLCSLPHGVIIVTGPTGSGKTTLLYAMLASMNRDSCCVMSVEDPVEYLIPGIAQVAVRPQIGITFPGTLRSMLRQDPDVIMVGEVRDIETLQLVCQASLTGHLVFTTLHAASAAEALKRVVDIGVPPFLANASISAVISQRLVRILCPECRQEAPVPTEHLPGDAQRLIERLGRKPFWEPQGCSKCRGTGYHGRTAIHEILIPDDRVKAMLAKGAAASEIRQAAAASGFKTFIVDGLEKAARGVTSVQEVLRVTLGPNE